MQETKELKLALICLLCIICLVLIALLFFSATRLFLPEQAIALALVLIAIVTALFIAQTLKVSKNVKKEVAKTRKV